MKLLLISWLLFITACTPQAASQQAITPIRNISALHDLTENVNKPFIVHPIPNNYSICYGHSCNKIGFVSLSEQEWHSITTLFSPIASSAELEREQIKTAIARLETYTGQYTGTSNDLAENAISGGLSNALDCIDEATNSTVYLRMLQNARLLHFHTQSHRLSRGGLVRPHNTASIIETASNTRYAVDSWFGNNGEQPAIIPLTLWKSGWKPKKN